jgi:hypothetical protein
MAWLEVTVCLSARCLVTQSAGLLLSLCACNPAGILLAVERILLASESALESEAMRGWFNHAQHIKQSRCQPLLFKRSQCSRRI